jgi:glutamine amidotransferase
MSAPEVTVIDYGVGNLLSVQRGLEHCGAMVTVSSDSTQILNAKRIVLPGVGAFGNAMRALERLGLVATIREIAQRRTPLLGICLGMQLLMDESEEFGTTLGLGLIPGRVIPVPTKTVSNNPQKIPHIGWSALQLSSAQTSWRGTLLENNKSGESAYFVHSFMVVPTNPADHLADCIYGGHLVPATIRRDRITGCQFHPEKSGEVGLKILRQFILQ